MFSLLPAIKPGVNPLLFPCGNLRRETIPTEMGKAGKLKSLWASSTVTHQP